MKIDPSWISAGLGVVLAVGGLVSAWFRLGSRITVLESQGSEWHARIDADIKDGDRRLSQCEGRLERLEHFHDSASAASTSTRPGRQHGS